VASDALVGYTGFVGSNLTLQHRFEWLYNSRNIEEIRGGSFERLVIAGIQAKKWWANLHPDEDWALIENLLDPLAEVTARQVILISTIDVLPAGSCADEDTELHGLDNHPYGLHRLKAEDRIRASFDDVTVVRLPALFGPGLKKNILFDLLNRNQLELINPASRFQYYDLNDLWSDIEVILAAGIRLVHLFTEPVKTAEIIARFFPETTVGAATVPAAAYDFRTQHAALFGGTDGYIRNRAQLLDRMHAFINTTRRSATA
jgi:hypothetical protein